MKKYDDDIVIDFHHVTKEYHLYSSERARLMGYLVRHKKHRIKRASDHLTFQIKKGESVAILGKNGAGKSTLLKMLTGVVYPTKGEIFVRGRIGSLLELAAGFDQSFTGRENVYLKCLLLGIEREEVDKIIDQIIEFADLGEYIDQPVRTYSSGMKARLGFAINVHIEPSVLVVDEALSVGDKFFQEKCRSKIKQICAQDDTTFILVTHSANTAKDFCDRGILLVDGKIKFDGPIKQAIDMYQKP